MLQASREATRSIHVSQKGHLPAPNNDIPEALRKHLFSRLDHVFDHDEDAVLDFRTVGSARRHALLHLSAQSEGKASSAGLAWSYLLHTAGLSESPAQQTAAANASFLGLLPCATALAMCQWRIFRTRSPHEHDFLHYKQLEVTYRADSRRQGEYTLYNKALQAVAQAFKATTGNGRLGVVLSTAACGLSQPDQDVRIPVSLTPGPNAHVWSCLEAAAANPLLAGTFRNLCWPCTCP